MTDVVTPPSTSEDSARPGGDDPIVEWAPTEPAPRRRRWPLLLWIGLPVAALAGAGWYFGTTLIAPGVTVAGVPVGGLTQEAATTAIADTIADTSVTVDVGTTAVTVTGADLGATLPAADLARDALAAAPAWNVGAWFPAPDRSSPELDPAASETALATTLADVWEEPVDATVAYDDSANAYAVTPAVDGRGVEPDLVTDAYLGALLAGEAEATLETELVALEADITTDAATARTDEINAMLADVGFYVGDERTVPVKPDTTASWLTLTPDPEQGTIDVTADEAAIEKAVANLPERVDRDAVDATVVTDANGTVLRTETEGRTGRELAGTAGIAAAFATQLAAGEAAYALEVTETDFETTSLERLLEVDLSSQRVTLMENGDVVDSWAISSGKSGWETNLGWHKVQAKVRIQDMGNDEVGYLQPDVEWVSYFSGDQAFHAVYWHQNWGTPTSHGCVGMPTDLAKWVYEWAPVGTDVWVHA
ncbi:L,D-transpeptidase family protein [Microbacterium sp. LRZ72]|uniref:L,D-transpeptidase family protein n=1 Tax=Microbacterium sp. LRZ72 TaxID=2942481 RepID=UPI0029AC706D|nr:L,D-transpeptidase family protein [Microbacterium sp. LRZ72]MDX2375990.1 L,D-transpeptidase family protein [Microbacterium sp. LRZ72]